MLNPGPFKEEEKTESAFFQKWESKIQGDTQSARGREMLMTC